MSLMMDNLTGAEPDDGEDHRYRVRLQDVFEGPMDLLVHLIKKAEVDIYDIPISQITAQYLEYLEWMQQMNIDFAGDFVLMASTLTHIKSRMLLPAQSGEEEEEDPGWRSPDPCWNTFVSNRQPNNWRSATCWEKRPLPAGPTATSWKV
jgi:segregation and condensation protein A